MSALRMRVTFASGVVSLLYLVFALATLAVALMIAICEKGGVLTASTFALLGVLLSLPPSRLAQSETVMVASTFAAVVNSQASQDDTNMGLNAVAAIVLYLLTVFHWTVFLRASAPVPTSVPSSIASVFDAKTTAATAAAWLTTVRMITLIAFAVLDAFGFRSVWLCAFAFLETSSDYRSRRESRMNHSFVAAALRVALVAATFAFASYDFSYNHTYAFVVTFPIIIVLSTISFGVATANRMPSESTASTTPKRQSDRVGS